MHLTLRTHHAQDLSRHDASKVIAPELARSLRPRYSFGSDRNPPTAPRPGSVSKPDESPLYPAVTVPADKPDTHLPSICQRSRKLEGIVEHLRLAGLAYIPISHLHWGLWGLILARTSKVPGFDYEAYGRQRLGEYRRLRPDLVKGAG